MLAQTLDHADNRRAPDQTSGGWPRCDTDYVPLYEPGDPSDVSSLGVIRVADIAQLDWTHHAATVDDLQDDV